MWSTIKQGISGLESVVKVAAIAAPLIFPNISYSKGFPDYCENTNIRDMTLDELTQDPSEQEIMPPEYTQLEFVFDERYIDERNEFHIGRIENYLNNHILDIYKTTINNAGWKFFIFDGQITKIPELSHLKANDYGSLPMGYVDTKNKRAYTSQDVIDYRDVIPLHEFGHVFDVVFGIGKVESKTSRLSNRDDFFRVFLNNEGLANTLDQFELTREYFARVFEIYYKSCAARKILEEDYPDVYKYFKDLEQEIIDGNIM